MVGNEHTQSIYKLGAVDYKHKWVKIDPKPQV